MEDFQTTKYYHIPLLFFSSLLPPTYSALWAMKVLKNRNTSVEGIRTSHKPCHGCGWCGSCTCPQRTPTSQGPQKEEGRGWYCRSTFPFCVLKGLERSLQLLPLPNNFLRGFLAKEKNWNFFPSTCKTAFICQAFQKYSSDSEFWLLPPWHFSSLLFPWRS